MKMSQVAATALMFTGLFGVAHAKAAAPTNEGQIMEILTTANKGEIQAGQSAQQKATNPSVKSFASEMVSAHSKNQSEGEALAKKLGVKPMPADKAAALKKDAEQKMAAMNAKSGKDFDKAYIDDQVAMHTTVLSEIESELIPAAKNAELKSFLDTTKSHVSMHLTEAKKIQASLK